MASGVWHCPLQHCLWEGRSNTARPRHSMCRRSELLECAACSKHQRAELQRKPGSERPSPFASTPSGAHRIGFHWVLSCWVHLVVPFLLLASPHTATSQMQFTKKPLQPAPTALASTAVSLDSIALKARAPRLLSSIGILYRLWGGGVVKDPGTATCLSYTGNSFRWVFAVRARYPPNSGMRPHRLHFAFRFHNAAHKHFRASSAAGGGVLVWHNLAGSHTQHQEKCR